MRTICSLEVTLSRFRAIIESLLFKSICGFDFGSPSTAILRASSRDPDANHYGSRYKIPAPSHMASWVT